MVALACVSIGALVGTLILPQFYANADTTTVSTLYKTATNVTTGSTARSASAPNGAQTGTAKPGDTLNWVVSYQNNTNADASVDLKDVITSAGTYVPGSLKTPPNVNALGTLSPQFSVNGGTSWTTGTPPSTANAVGFRGTLVPKGTASKSLAFPSPQSDTVSTPGGDVYNMTVRNNLLYGVYHHARGAVVYCGQLDGSTCPGWPTNSNFQTWSSVVGTPVGTGVSFAGVTAWQNGTWISGTKLFWFAGLDDRSSGGTGCLDLTTTTPTSCGYTPLISNLKDVKTGVGATIGSTGQRMGMDTPGQNIYAVAETTGGTSLICVNPATGGLCGPSAIIPLTTQVSLGDAAVTESNFGSYVFTAVKSSTAGVPWQVYCWRLSVGLCPGSWPVASTSTSDAFGGPPFAPILDTAGNLTGVCTIRNNSNTGSACWNLSGASLANNPYAGTNAQFTAAGNGTGDALLRAGARVYVSVGNAVTCLDFSVYSGTGTVPTCAGFTNVTSGTNYTTRAVTSIAPNCLVAVGHAGTIVRFNAITGGGCTGTSGPQTLTVTPLNSYCGSGAAGFRGWLSMSLPGLVTGTYTNSTVTLRDQNNTVIPNFNNITLAANGTLNLAGIPTTVTSITASVIVNGVNDPSGVVSGQIQIDWTGDPPQMCFQTTAPPLACDAAATNLTNNATAVTTSTGGSDSPAGNSSGATTFTEQAQASQCSLAIEKKPSIASARPGDVVTYTITVTNTGTQAYNNAQFNDPLTDVLLDATYNGNATADKGQVQYTNATLSWTGALAAGAKATITYSVTVKNPDSGDHRMLNTVTSTTTGSNCAAGSSDPLCASTVPISDLTVTKTVANNGVQTPAEVGDTISYLFTITNTGQTTLTGVAVTDQLAGVSQPVYTWPGTPGTLLAGQIATATATYELKQSDINTGIVTNSATASGNPPTGPPVITPPAGTTTPTPQQSDLLLTKDADVGGVANPAAVGNLITYTFRAKNTGNVTLTNVSIADPLPGLSALTYQWPGTAGVLLPDQTVVATATYRLTQADVNAGHVANTANSTGTPPTGPAIPSNPASTDTPLQQGPGIDLVKGVNRSQIQTPARVGDLLTYTFTATNTGNVTLTGVTIADPLPGLSALSYTWPIPASPGVLQPSQAVTATATYRVTQADIDAGQVDNTAVASGTPSTGTPVNSPPRSTDTPLTATPGLSFDKTADTTQVLSPAAVGNTITYRFTAQNTGTVTLHGVAIADQLAGLSPLAYAWPDPANPGVLLPLQSVTATATYQLTQADIDAGQVVNYAKATGVPPTGPGIESPPDTVPVPLVQNPAVEPHKDAVTDALQAPAVVGDTITYQFRAKNIGNVTLTNVTITEQLAGVTPLIYTWPDPARPGVLDPGAEVTATATYQVTQANIDSGHVVNSAVTRGTPPSGQNLTPPPSVTDTPLTSNPGLTLVKTADPSQLNSPTVAGDLISYHFTIQNTGNSTLTNVVITDDLNGISSIVYSWPGAAGTLLPTQTATAVATYSVTQADLDAGFVDNQAIATGVPPSGPSVDSPQRETHTPLSVAPALTVDKIADTVGVTTPARAGQQITYRFQAVNTGNQTLTGVVIDDILPNLSPLTYQWPVPASPGVLQPGQTVTATATYLLTQADVDAGHVANQAGATGVPPSGPPVDAPPDDVDTPLAATPSIRIEKSADLIDSADFQVGRTVTYTFVVTNDGNTTLANPHVDETQFTGSGLLSLITCPPTPQLVPLQQMTCTATYVLTQADIDTGQLDNEATATGTPPTGPDVVSPPDDVTIPASQSSDIRLVKTAAASALQSPPRAGDTLTYTFVATNNGNVTLTNVQITDPLPGLSTLTYAWPGTPNELGPGQLVVATATYQLTQADIDAGQVANTADVEGTPPTGPLVTDTDSENVPLAASPAIDIVKAADGGGVQSPAQVGDPVAYAFTITNTGNVTLTAVTLTDPLPGLSTPVITWPGAPGTLQPGQVATATAWYALTQADIDAGHVPNTATTTGTSPTGVGVADDDSADVSLAPGPAITIVKTPDASAVQSPAQVGDTITYAFVVTNTGNVTLTGVTLSDPLPGLTAPVITWPGTPGVLQPGQAATATASYQVTQSAIDAGIVSNTATTQGMPPTGTAVTDSDTADVPLDPGPAIDIVKTADSSAVQSPAQAGDTIRYTFVVTNSGNVTLTTVGITDRLAGVSAPVIAWPGMSGVLEPGQTATGTASYRLTQADIDAGHVVNSAYSTGTPPTGPPVDSPDDGTDTPLPHGPALRTVKTADASAVQSPAQVGDTITYTFEVTNTGNVTMTGVTITDRLPGVSTPVITWPGAPGVLQAGQSATGTSTYQLTQADIDAGQVSNAAFATGTPPSGPPVDSPDGVTDTPLPQGPAITLDKTADPSSVQSPAAVGDTVTYSFVITNTGNVTLTDVTLTDPLPGLTAPVIAWPGAPGMLNPGQVATATATYQLAQADIDSGHVANTATTGGTPPSGGRVTTNDSADVPLVEGPDITIVKAADDSAVQTPPRAGDIVTYTFTVTNTGNVLLTGVTVTDPLPGLSTPVITWPGVPGELAPGRVAIGTATYALTQADIDTGQVANTASTEGRSPTGSTVTDQDSEDVPLTAAPAIEIVKTADSSAVQTPAAAGDMITFGFVVTNTGNVTMTNVTITDRLAGVSAPVVAWPGTPGVLEPRQTATGTATYQVTQADVDAGHVANAAFSTGTPPTGPPVDSPDDTTDTPLPPGPAIAIVKTADVSGVQPFAQVNNTVLYRFTVTNTGNVTLTDVTITDPLPGMSAITIVWPGPDGVLQPGQVATATATYELTQADLDAGQVANTATTEGTPPTGTPVTDQDTAIVTIPPDPRIIVDKASDASQLSSPPVVGDTITYLFAITNTGNVTLTGVTITDSLPGLTELQFTWPGADGVLLPNQQATGAATYQLTQADLDAGHVANSVFATGMPPSGPPIDSPNDDTDNPLPSTPSLDTVKSADASAVQSPPQVGDPITYTFVVTNTGNVTMTDVTITDRLAGVTPPVITWPGTPGVLQAGEIATATSTYRLTQADIDAGHVANTAFSTGTPPTGPPVDSPDGGTDTPLPQDPTLSIVKTADTSAIQDPALVGDTITYTFVVTNTGNVTMTGVTITDRLPGVSAPVITWPGTSGTLAPAQAATGTSTYQLTQADIDAGHVANTAFSTGTPPQGPPVDSPDGGTDTPLPQDATISVTKDADLSAVQSPPRPGDTITYAFTASNTGTVTLTGVTIVDPLPGLSALTYAWPGAPGVLAPGQTVTATATYAITQADIDAGHVVNSAHSTGTPPQGPPVGSPDDGTDSPLPPAPDLGIVKSADSSALQTPPRVGDTITYTMVVTNTGNVTLTGVSITDRLPGVSVPTIVWPAAPGVLLPLQTATGTATYQLTQADIDAGHVANAAFATGTPPSGPPVVTPDGETDTPLPPSPSLTTVKTADASGIQSPSRVGDTITYTFVVTNTGNVTMTGVTITDRLPGVSAPVMTWPAAPGVLQPQQSATGTSTYQLTQADIDAGHVVNAAFSTGTPPQGPPVDSPDGGTDTPVPQDPELEIVKTADASAVQSPAAVGDTVTYTFVLTNTGDVTLVGVAVSDSLPGLSAPIYSWPGAVGVLAPGQTATATATYRLTQADVDAGHVANTAVSTGTPPSGPPVESPPDGTDTPLVSAPAMEMTKVADTAAVSSPARAGDTVTYRFTASNVGNVTLTGVSIVDPLPGLSALTYAWPGAAGRLAPGETVAASATYELTQADIDAGHVANRGTATGLPPSGPPVDAPPDQTDTPLTALPQLTLEKNADLTAVQSPAQPGDAVTYHFTVTNTGNVTMTGVQVTDLMAGLSPLAYSWPGAAGALAPGQTATAVATYRLTEADLAAGHVVNTATATGVPPSGGAITTPPADVDAPLPSTTLPAVSG